MDAIEIVTRFNAALNAANVPGMVGLLTSDSVFENTYPPPDGERFEGREAVRGFWEGFFRAAREPRIEIEEIFAAGDRCVMRWTYRWRDTAGSESHIRGVDVYRLRGGLIAEKLSYVKG
jgi:ketosteroid isomerase-like protein